MKEVGVDKNGRPKLEPSGEEVVFECDDVLMAIGQENSFPWIERNIGLEFDEWGMPKVDEATMMSTRPGVFFGGDAAWGPENIIWAVAHGHHAAVSIDRFCHGKPITERPPPGFNLISQKMGIHEWSYKNDYAPLKRVAMPHADKAQALRNLKVEVELGYDDRSRPRRPSAASTATCRRCSRRRCASSATPAWTSARSTASTSPTTMPSRRCARTCACRRATRRRTSMSPSALKTGRIMAKDEDVCLHCGLCAERCPTGRLGHAEVHVRGGAGLQGLSDPPQCLSALKGMEVGLDPVRAHRPLGSVPPGPAPSEARQIRR